MVCERSFIVRADGKLRKHYTDDNFAYNKRVCAGSGVLAEGFEWMKKEDE